VPVSKTQRTLRTQRTKKLRNCKKTEKKDKKSSIQAGNGSVSRLQTNGGGFSDWPAVACRKYAAFNRPKEGNPSRERRSLHQQTPCLAESARPRRSNLRRDQTIESFQTSPVFGCCAEDGAPSAKQVTQQLRRVTTDGVPPRFEHLRPGSLPTGKRLEARNHRFLPINRQTDRALRNVRRVTSGAGHVASVGGPAIARHAGRRSAQQAPAACPRYDCKSRTAQAHDDCPRRLCPTVTRKPGHWCRPDLEGAKVRSQPVIGSQIQIERGCKYRISTGIRRPVDRTRGFRRTSAQRFAHR